jgi:ribosomal protein S18 acetylase RimI-like enzyme
MFVQSVLETNKSIGIGYANSLKTAALARQWKMVDVMTLAFGNDPLARWLYPDSQQYLRYFANFIRLYGGKAFDLGSAFYVGDFVATALWLPPNVEPDKQGLMSLFESTIPKEIRNDLFTILEEKGNYRPTEPHWYLPMIGTDPVYQGRGVGSALLRHTLNVIDRDGKPAYLESSNPKHINFYKKFGFEVIGKIQTGSSPPIFPMRRESRVYRDN